MIDFHSHIIFEVDDGANSLEKSVKLLKEAEMAGFNSIILTPHYMEDYYEHPADEIKEKIEILRKICQKENINLKLYQANEIYIANDMVDLLKNNMASTVNRSQYVLFELPMHEEPLNLLEVIYSLKENNITPIIAHPERYIYVQKDISKLNDLLDMGVLFQSNYGSIIGQYGSTCKKTIKKLLKNNCIHFFGSDVHRPETVYYSLEKAKKKLIKLLGKEKFEELSEINAQKVLDNEPIYFE